MSRKIVPLITGEKYHIYNRGCDKRIIFTCKNDYLRFYLTLQAFNCVEPTYCYENVKNKQYASNDRLVKIIAYALLPNHFHLILEQKVDGGISEFMKRILVGYTAYFNDRHDRSGVLFQGKFKRIHIDRDQYYNYLFAYVNENHVVHNVKIEDEIYFSSSFHYQGKMKSRLIEDVVNDYNVSDAIKLALQISEQREILKTES